MPQTRARQTPTIKGLFVNSHVNRLREEKGDAAVQELERLYGGRVVFKALENVPLREEVRIIELCLGLLDPALAAGHDAARQAGRLHFANFCSTRLGSTLLSTLPHTPSGLKTLLINCGSIGRSVFKHTNLACVEQGTTLTIVMENTDYPPEHFEGFLSAWAETYGLPPGAVSSKIDGTIHRYVISGF